MQLFLRFLRRETKECIEKGVRLQIVGRRDRLAPRLVREIERSEEATGNGSRVTVRIAIDYSSRDLIARAAAECQAPTRESFVEALAVAMNAREASDVDLLIRTGREKRISDFLLWEIAYAELYFTDVLWPDFARDDLAAAIEDFAHRQRRFGRVAPVARVAGGV
jgi:undecaprenyl diphosphate synthase